MNTKKLLIVPALFIVLGVWAQEANLTINPVAKKKYDIELNSTTNVTQNMGGMEMKMNSSSVAKVVMEIEEVTPNENFTVLSTWKEIKSTSSVMGKDTTVNFDDLHLEMRTVYDKSGKSIKNERVDKSTSSDPIFAMVEQMATGMKFPILPAKTVKKGDTWTSNRNDTIKPVESPFEMIIDAEDKYTYAGVETKDGKEYYRINIEGPTKVSGEGSQMGMDMTIEGTGVNEGYLLLDKTTLLPVFVDEKVGLDMSIMISGAQSMAIPMTQNTSTTTKFTEIK
ncbi:MAG: DUF6263 family protein [Petrimonas sp.]|jgi:hypothetical protein